MGCTDRVVSEELLEELKGVEDRVLQPPCSVPDLLNLLDEVVSLLSKIGQAPPKPIQEALLPTMNALISHNLMHNSDPDVVITIAACLNEIMRITAPVAPYDDDKMKEIFELIVSSFDNLSCPPGRCYSKAVLILESVARLRSCVMMLDLDCDLLVINMFRLFQKHISSNHPRTVFLAMEKIMSVMIKESDSVSEELLEVLLDSIRKQNQHAFPVSYDMGVKVVEECWEKLKEYIMEAVSSRGLCLDDYAPILSSIYGNADKDLVHDSPRHPPLKVIECCSQNAGADLETSAEMGGKLNSHDSDEEYEGLTGNSKSSLTGPLGLLKKSSAAPRSKKAVLTEDEPSKREIEEAIDLGNKKVRQATPLGVSKKKGYLTREDISGGSGKKSASALSRKDRIQSNDALGSQKTQPTSDDDVVETPHGRKNYKEDLIGCRIKVWWPLDRRYYEGTISSFDASNKKHKVDYDDGDKEVLNLHKEQWEFVGVETPDIDLFVNKKTSRPRSDMPKKREASSVFEKESSRTNTVKREIMPDSENAPGNSSHHVVDKVGFSETKRLRLSDEQRS